MTERGKKARKSLGLKRKIYGGWEPSNLDVE
jgi:hypothetical protein